MGSRTKKGMDDEVTLGNTRSRHEREEYSLIEDLMRFGSFV